MGKVEILALTLISLLAIGLYHNTQAPTVNTESLFESWMDLHGKHYDTKAERVYRYGVWMKNFEFVQAHNAEYLLGDQTFEVEMNHFADLTSEEFGASYLMLNSDVKKTDKCKGSTPAPTDLPAEVDWTDKGK